MTHSCEFTTETLNFIYNLVNLPDDFIKAVLGEPSEEEVCDKYGWSTNISRNAFDEVSKAMEDAGIAHES